jgi:transposase
VLACAEPGAANSGVARALRVSRPTVATWRRRFAERGPDGLLDEPRPGAPRTIADADVERVITLTPEATPPDATHWSTRRLAAAAGMSPTAAVSRIWRAFALRPHRAEAFELSADRPFVEKVRDIVGLDLNPPDRALALCAGETPQVQAQAPAAPVLPMRPGQAERRPHDYVRHGTTDLSAALALALDVTAGRVIGACRPRHRGLEFRASLDQIDADVPADLDVHLVLDNAATHKTQLIRGWLAKRPRDRPRFTPTSASRLNPVESWFALLSARQLKRGAFRSTGELEEAIRRHIAATDAAPKPFAWTKPADGILASVARFCQRTSNSDH